MKRWFASYIQTYSDGRFEFGNTVYEGEHPIVRTRKWSLHGRKQTNSQDCILLSFQEVDDSIPKFEEVSFALNLPEDF